MAKYESYRVGDHEFSYLSFPIIARTVEYTYLDLDAVAFTLTIPIAAGTVLLGVAHETTTIFVGGTPPLLDVGDGTDPDAFIDQTDLDLETVGNFILSLGKANALAGGKKYNAAGSVVLTFGETQTAGAGTVYLFELDVNTNWRTAGQF